MTLYGVNRFAATRHFAKPALSGVAIYVGATALTRTPRGPHSAASDLVR